eukprot:m.735229 g.735229  ORF g.735229 m.735229 type:complete len:156 (+) comp58890_c0_seq1:1927-2394(+)
MGGDDEKATGESANAAWVHARGMWLAYLTTVVLAHLLLLSIPVLSTEAVWTLTNVLHAVVTFVVFHWVKGSPTETFDDGATASQTHWEQICDPEGAYSTTRRFLIAFPIVLFIVTTMYTHHEEHSFIINLLFMSLAVVPKMPLFEGVRLFNINKY